MSVSVFRHLEPERVAPDTTVIRTMAGEGMGPAAVFVNSAVITGSEPVIVDTGVAASREKWLDQVFGIVEPADVRWIYLSHDDHDHIGNVVPMLELCTNATLVTTAFMVERFAAEALLPVDRMRWVNDGDRFRAGDHQFVAVTPPTFDSPTTRGLYDVTTGVYWAVDSFAAAVPFEITNVDELEPEFYRESVIATNAAVSPWTRWLDPVKYGAHIDRIRGLGASTVISGHGAALHGAQIDDALDLLAELPNTPPQPLPGNEELDLLAELFSSITAQAA